MHVTDVTLCVYKQNLNSGLLQQRHFWAGLTLNLLKNDVVVIALHSDFVYRHRLSWGNHPSCCPANEPVCRLLRKLWRGGGGNRPPSPPPPPSWTERRQKSLDWIGLKRKVFNVKDASTYFEEPVIIEGNYTSSAVRTPKGNFRLRTNFKAKSAILDLWSCVQFAALLCAFMDILSIWTKLGERKTIYDSTKHWSTVPGKGCGARTLM